jgi:hypothetical protein
MSKLFNGSADLVTVTQQTAINNVGGSPGSRSAFAWIWLNSYGEFSPDPIRQGRIFDKNASGGGWVFQTYNDPVLGLLAALQASLGGTTSGRAYAASNTLRLREWFAVAVTYKPADGGPRLWVGTERVPMAEVTYSTMTNTTRQDVVGYASDAAQNLIIGNQAAADRSFDGRQAHLSLWEPDLSLAQLDALRLDSTQTLAGATRHAYWRMPLTDAANVCLDTSGNGNNGTVTGTAVAADPVTVVTPQAAFPLGFFPIGVGFQPIAEFGPWPDRGINTMYGMRADIDTVDAWTAAVNALGLYFIRPPRPVLADDAGETRLLAWEQPDEPEIPGTDPATLLAAYNAMKAAAPTRPVLQNFAGPFVLSLAPYPIETLAEYQAYIANGDWIANDIYPVGTLVSPNTGRLETVGMAVDQLASWSGTKPQFAWIETSNQFAGLGTPTPAEVRAMIWDAIIHGARGIFYYPKHFSRGVVDDHDNTPTDVATEITTQNAIITALATALQDAINPAVIHATAVWPIEVGWRSVGGAHYLFALNMSNATRNGQSAAVSGIANGVTTFVYGESRTVAVASGAITDDFAPHALHIYVVPEVQEERQAAATQ